MSTRAVKDRKDREEASAPAPAHVAQAVAVQDAVAQAHIALAQTLSKKFESPEDLISQHRRELPERLANVGLDGLCIDLMPDTKLWSSVLRGIKRSEDRGSKAFISNELLDFLPLSSRNIFSTPTEELSEKQREKIEQKRKKFFQDFPELCHHLLVFGVTSLAAGTMSMVDFFNHFSHVLSAARRCDGQESKLATALHYDSRKRQGIAAKLFAVTNLDISKELKEFDEQSYQVALPARDKPRPSTLTRDEKEKRKRTRTRSRSRNRRQPSPKKCYKCGSTKHLLRDCRRQNEYGGRGGGGASGSGGYGRDAYDKSYRGGFLAITDKSEIFLFY